MMQSLVELSPDPWCLRQPEVRLPTPDVGPQMIHYILHTAAATSAGQLPDALLERPHRLFGDLAFDHSALTWPEAVAQELATKHAGHCATLMGIRKRAVVYIRGNRSNAFAMTVLRLASTHISQSDPWNTSSHPWQPNRRIWLLTQSRNDLLDLRQRVLVELPKSSAEVIEARLAFRRLY